MTILLINPPYRGKGETIERRYRCTRLDPHGWMHPPLPLMQMSSILKECGTRVELIDAVKLKLDNQEIIRIVKKCPPDLVIVWSGNFSYKVDIETLRAIKTNFPELITVLTGTDLIAAFPGKFIDYDFIDMVTIGEPELTMYDLVKYFNHEIPQNKIRNIVYKKNGQYIFTKKETLNDLDSLPWPDREIIDNDAYKGFPYFKERFTDILTSRGCPYRCSFCTAEVFWGPKYRTRSPLNVADEIEYCCEKYHMKAFFMIDEEFAIDKARVHKICDEIINRNLKIKWGGETRVDTVDEELIKKMAQAGCTYIHYGVESGSDRELKYYNKQINAGQTVDAFRWMRKYGIESCATAIIGTPISRLEDVRDTVKLIKKIKPDYIHISPLIPHFGSKLYYQLKEEGSLKNADDFSRQVKPNILFKPKYLTEKQIKNEYRRAWLALSFSPAYLFQHLIQAIKKRDGIFLKESIKAAFWIFRTFIFYAKPKQIRDN